MPFLKRSNLKKSSQILLITLLVLTILSIITVSLIVLVNKDVKQVVSSDKYEQAYNVAESQLTRVLSKYTNYKIPISQLTQDFLDSNQSGDLKCSFTASPLQYTEYDCKAKNKLFSAGNNVYTTTLIAKDSKDVINYILKKDKSLELNLNSGGAGYSGNIILNWDNPAAALEVSLFYLDSSNNYQVIKDVYDYSASIFPNLINSYTPLNGGLHQFNFTSSQSTSTKFAVPLPPGAKAVSLRVTLRINQNTASGIKLSVSPDNYANYPAQMRMFSSQSYDSGESAPPVAFLDAQIPLNPQTDDIFDYGFLTNGFITNN